MVFEKIYDNNFNNFTMYDYFPSEDVYNKRKNGKPAKEIKRETTKEYISMFVKQHLDLRNVDITVSYYTDDGMVSLEDVKLLGDQSMKEEEIRSLLFRDPKSNATVESGEYNNDIKGKRLYGVSIKVLYLDGPNTAKDEKPKTAKAKETKEAKTKPPLGKMRKSKFDYVLA